MDNKKCIIIFVLKILESNSDKNNPLTQTKIADIISDKYPCDRKTIGRNIATLKKIGYPIIKTNNGFYLDTKKFSIDEKDFIIDSINSSTKKSLEEKEEIIGKLLPLLNQIYRK